VLEVAALVLAAEESVPAWAVVVKIQGEKPVVLVEEMLEALKLCAVPLHIFVELVGDAGAAGVDHNLDIGVLVAVHLEVVLAASAVLAYVVGYHEDEVAYSVHSVDYK
jgi:hypothetical protein